MSETISAALVKELRERTNAPLMDCKKALQKAKGNIEEAVKEMRKAGKTKADNKAGRQAAEGQIFILVNDDKSAAAILELNCETDFCAKDSNFIEFGNAVIARALAAGIADVNELSTLALKSNNDETVEQARQALVAKIGENVQIRRVVLVSAKGELAIYSHGGRIGVIIDGNSSHLHDLAMHIAATNPQVVKQADVPQHMIDNERTIFVAQAEQSGKPADIVEKMVEGRIKKYLDEVSLLGQPFVKDSSVTVAQLLNANKEEIFQFVRFEVGEGIQKVQTNFAEEVMAQVR
ncbi:MAG: translation elongation factor Ts [Gammaproteobacteria bacterium]